MPSQSKRAPFSYDKLEQAPDLEHAVDADVRFHRLLAEATGNPLFVLMLETIAQLLRESRRRTIKSAGKQLALDEHRKILATVRAGDREAARQAMQFHMKLIERDLDRAKRL